MTRIAFCDDDAALLHQMQDFLEQYRTLRGVQLELTPYTKPMELLADIETGVRFDVLFLDVLMPGINGIDAAREIRRYDTAVQIIFVTSSSEFAVQSYVVGAYYYQLKPIWKDSFFRLTDAVLAECRKRASTYRHDLRHHMQFLAGCIENGRTEQALGYIRSVCSEIEAGKVTAYCENEAANLIFSAFADRAAKAGVQFTVQAGISQKPAVSESDLCVLLSNALENALHAAVRCREAGHEAFIETSGHEKGHKLFLQITNSCLPDVQLRDGIPVTDQPGHGLGVRSICAISERYGGLTSFAAKDGQFTLRVML
ncbi:MAG: GHKL domain-containing protein [Faecalibacterium prausnitzii]|nr:GHKL domain-containing protein [Faecalibacterium prausnitzii]MEE0792342.1 GHKL domain-containing protein [Faecalibacterium prausnitzii]